MSSLEGSKDVSGQKKDEVIDSFKQVIESNADGELGERMDEDVDDPHLSSMAAAYNRMIEDWVERFEAAEEFGSQVVERTDQVNMRVDRAQDSSQNVDENIEGISQGVVEQNEYIQDISDEMRNLSATIEEIAASSDEVLSAADRASDCGESGMDAANDVIEDLRNLKDESSRTVENVEDLSEMMEDIKEVAEFIDEVADKTNILALNANIEASRAGEAGAGFSVVAEEVKELAEETQSAAEDIQESIENVRSQVETTVSDIHDTRESVIPAFTGLGATHWDGRARGTIVGMTRGTRREHIVRATLESIAYQTRDVAEAMEADTGLEMNSLKVDGGAVKNNFLCQLQSDIIGTEIVRPEVDETTALGSAYAAGLAVGYWDNLDELKLNWNVDREFEPKMERDKADKLYDRWYDAVERSLYWAREE